MSDVRLLQKSIYTYTKVLLAYRAKSVVYMYIWQSMRLLTAGSLVRAQHGEPSWGDEIEPPPKTLDFSRVFRVFRGNFIPLCFLHPFLD